MPPALTSRVFADGAFIPARCSGDEFDHSPELNWHGSPPETEIYALLVHDRDSPSGDLTHWLPWPIPVTTEEFVEGPVSDSAGVPGTNDFGKLGYGGPCPLPRVPQAPLLVRALRPGHESAGAAAGRQSARG